MKYMIVVEKAESNYAAYAPDLLGCAVTGDSREETIELMKEAIEFHIEGLQESGTPVPPPTADSTYVEVPAA